MYSRSHRERPKPWEEHRAQLRPSPLLPFHRIDWHLSWLAWALSNWALLDVLDHLGSLSVLIAVIFYFADSANRVKQRHYQAWQVVNSAEGKGGNGGRIEALQELNQDRVSLVGVEASGAFLQSIQLSHAKLSRCDLHASDLRESSFSAATLTDCNLHEANFRNANLGDASIDDADLGEADLHGANLSSVDLSGTDLSNTDLRGADVRNLKWSGIASMKGSNIWGMRNASPEFIAFAKAHGAISMESDDGQP